MHPVSCESIARPTGACPLSILRLMEIFTAHYTRGRRGANPIQIVGPSGTIIRGADAIVGEPLVFSSGGPYIIKGKNYVCRVALSIKLWIDSTETKDGTRHQNFGSYPKAPGGGRWGQLLTILPPPTILKGPGRPLLTSQSEL